jgi:hypothetical protein
MTMTHGRKGCWPMCTGSTFLSLFLILCCATTVRSQEQANEIVCSSGTACRSGFIPLFSSNGGSTTVTDSLLSQGGSTVTLSGNETLSGHLAAGGSVSGSAGSFSGNVSLAGNLSLSHSTPSAGNVLKGAYLFLHDSGSNTFLGLNAGNLSVTGNNNTGIGNYALQANTTGCCNTATGNNALLRNTMGGGNTASGDGALYSNTTGSGNTATGRWALIGNTTGTNNTATGITALQSNCSSPCQYGTLQLGSGNTATGAGALFSNTDGSGNTATGVDALHTNCASPCYYGEGVGGGQNTATGTSALYNNTTGSDNTADGNTALNRNTTGSSNAAIGVNALFSNTAGNFNTAIGFNADVAQGNLSNATAIGYGAVVNASDKIRLGNSFVTVIEGQVPFTFTSDKNQKENFEPVHGEAVLAKLANIPVSSWNYIGQDAKQFRHYGPVAQDFFAAFGHDAMGTIGTPTTLNIGDVAGILWIGVQALQDRTEKLVQENLKLRAEMQSLSQDNGELRATLQRVDAENLASRREFQNLFNRVEAISSNLDRSSTLAQSQPYVPVP